ncbi:glycosyltransferase family 2 protein [Candidatus Pelagibacter sp.]|nr:glycosyltransferase family 2 protein [Candidatus Pelagibacter sp.]
MQDKLKISVIVPVYNSEKYIGRCLRSLHKQNVNKKNFEIIIINDSSKDNSIVEIKKYKTTNIKIINNEKNLGLPASLNIGIKAATGSLIVRVDSDDWVHEEFLNIMSTFLSLNKKIDSVACDYTMTDDKENPIIEKNCIKFPIGCGIMFRLQHLLEMGLYDEKFIYAEEKALRKKYLRNYSITRIPISLYRYRQHSKNRSKNKKLVKKYSLKTR